MTINIPFPELQSLLLAKAKQEVTLNYVDEQTVAVGKAIKIFGFEKQLSMKLHVQEVSGSDFVLAHDNRYFSDNHPGISAITTHLS